MAVAVNKARHHISSPCINFFFSFPFSVEAYESSVFDIDVTLKGTAVENIHYHCIPENYIRFCPAHRSIDDILCCYLIH